MSPRATNDNRLDAAVAKLLESGKFQPLFDKAASASVAKAMGLAKKLGESLSQVSQIAQQGNEGPGGNVAGLQLGLKMAGDVGGPLVKAIAGAVSQAVAVLEKESEKLRARLEKELGERINQRLAEADTAQRYKDDVQFQAKLNREAQGAYAASVADGWQPRGARLSDGDF